MIKLRVGQIWENRSIGARYTIYGIKDGLVNYGTDTELGGLDLERETKINNANYTLLNPKPEQWEAFYDKIKSRSNVDDQGCNTP